MAVEPPPEASDSPTIEPTARGARVFRVEAAPISPSVEAGLATLPPPTEGSTYSGTLPEHAPATPRERRIATDKRPGPVLHVVHAPPKRQRESEVLGAEEKIGALEQRLFLQDGDELILHARTAPNQEFAQIGLGECRGKISSKIPGR